MPGSASAFGEVGSCCRRAAAACRARVGAAVHGFFRHRRIPKGTMSIAATSRSLFRTTTGNRASRIYLAVVAAALVWAHVDAAFVAQADSSFVGIYSVAVTAPISVALLLVGAFEALPFTLLIVVCALVNANPIRWAVRRIAAHR
jgi:hypothetical protein